MDWLEGDSTFEVESILGHKFIKNGNKFILHYLIKWAGFDEAHNSWEPADKEHYAELVSEYKKLHPTITIVKPLYKRSCKNKSVLKEPLPITVTQSLAQQTNELTTHLNNDVDTVMDSTEPLLTQSKTESIRKSKRKRMPNRRLA